MIDLNALLGQLQAAGADPNTVNQILTSLRGNAALNEQLSPGTRANIERAAQAMQSGDYNAARAAASQLMGTPEGALLTSTVLQMFGQ